MSMTDEMFVRSPDLWPRWPLCPMVKRNTTELVVGYLVNRDLRGQHEDPTVYVGYVFAADPARDEKVKYDSFEKLLEEWRVD